MRTAEAKNIVVSIDELRAEMQNLRREMDRKLEHTVKTILDAFKGFGILDPEEDMWTEEQVCKRYNLSRKSMYKARKEGRIAFQKIGKGRNCKIIYRKADVIEFFSELNK